MDERQQTRGETGSAGRSDGRESAKEGGRKLESQTLELTRSQSHQALQASLPPFDSGELWCVMAQNSQL